MKDFKICVNCKYHYLFLGDGPHHWCSYNVRTFGYQSKPDIVTGDLKEVKKNICCSLARQEESYCGPDGLKFQEKEKEKTWRDWLW